MAKVKVTKQSSTGRNEKFEISRADLVKQIKAGLLPGYHIRVINDIETPVSNPDKNKKNNLG